MALLVLGNVRSFPGGDISVVETANHHDREDGEPNGGVRNFERELKRSSADVGADGGKAFVELKLEKIQHSKGQGCLFVQIYTNLECTVFVFAWLCWCCIWCFFGHVCCNAKCLVSFFIFFGHF